ncbi:MAG TPA: DUF599 domain-containing protein [Rhodocyclaceae bacterium]|jgi:uncharacterized membrane protein|nr:DUF599 domain-containing protein [Rhodocyclaceae bacterium]
MFGFPLIDAFVLVWFVVCWAGYAAFAWHRSGTHPSLVVAMRVYRREWFRRMLGNENRIGDTAALNSLLGVSTFFASTSLLILGGLVALLGTTERVIEVVSNLPFTGHDSEVVWHIKIILMIGVFIYAFFKFTWSIRQFNFCGVLIGAAPQSGQPDEHKDFVDTIVSIASFSEESFNHGLRAFYFALAVLSWFLHPWLFVAASALVVYVLYQREFRSKALHALTRPSSVTQSLHLPERMLAELRLGARSS